MSDDRLQRAVDRVPPGAWAVGVSGGADSVALLDLLLLRLRRRRDTSLRLHVVHLDHQTRAGASADDAAFVAELARRRGLPATVALRSDVERDIADVPTNAPARYRAARLALFARVVREHGLDGVILAHHADDQAETVMLRLIRGGGATALAGMSVDARIGGGLRVCRPLLDVPGAALRAHLRTTGQDWREDASNLSDDYRRNRVRRILSARPALVDALLELGTASRDLRAWLRDVTPALGERFAAAALADLPPLLAREAARAWLISRGAPPDDVSPATLDRLIAMATDAASPARQHFPGGVRVRRRGGEIACDNAA